MTNGEILSFEYIRRELLDKHLAKKSTQEEMQELHRLDQLLCPIDIVGVFYQEMETLEAKLKIAIEALEYYGNRMDSGGTARRALEAIKGE